MFSAIYNMALFSDLPRLGKLTRRCCDAWEVESELSHWRLHGLAWHLSRVAHELELAQTLLKPLSLSAFSLQNHS